MNSRLMYKAHMGMSKGKSSAACQMGPRLSLPAARPLTRRASHVAGKACRAQPKLKALPSQSPSVCPLGGMQVVYPLASRNIPGRSPTPQPRALHEQAAEQRMQRSLARVWSFPYPAPGKCQRSISTSFPFFVAECYRW